MSLSHRTQRSWTQRFWPAGALLSRSRSLRWSRTERWERLMTPWPASPQMRTSWRWELTCFILLHPLPPALHQKLRQERGLALSIDFMWYKVEATGSRVTQGSPEWRQMNRQEKQQVPAKAVFSPAMLVFFSGIESQRHQGSIHAQKGTHTQKKTFPDLNNAKREMCHMKRLSWCKLRHER